MIGESTKHIGQRIKLVGILKDKGILDINVLDAISNIPRHLFMDSAFQNHAYQDKAFPIGENQTISQPYTVAFQTQELKLKKGSMDLKDQETQDQIYKKLFHQNHFLEGMEILSGY